MKITFVLWGLDRTGGVRVIFEIANRLSKKGHDVNIVALGGQGDWFPLNVKTQTVATIPWRFKTPHAGWRSETQFINILSLAKKLPKSDVTVATFYPTAYSTYLGGSGSLVYYIQQYEAVMYLQSDSLFKKVLNRLMTSVVDGTYKLPLNWIVNSSWANNILKNKFGREGKLVFPAINHNIFYPRRVTKKDKKRIVCLGKSAPVKGLLDAFKAVKMVYKKKMNIELVLYGSEPDIKPPIGGKYVYKPSDEELAELYSSADVALCPSWYESFPLPPLEAMACGSPVITTRYGTEDYAYNGENCIVVPPRNPKLLADATLKILSDEALAKKLKKEGLKTSQAFTWDRTADRAEQVLKEYANMQ